MTSNNRSNTTKKAFLFDFDGVLGKTMEEHFKAWKTSFKDTTGITITNSDYYPLEGMRLIEVAKTLCKIYEIDPKHAEQIMKGKIENYIKQNETRLYKGVEEFIDYLKKKEFLIAIVTGSIEKQLRKTVRDSFLDKFDTIVTSESIKKGKPYPDPYLEAANQLKLKPKECIVVENAPLGIKAAKNADMFCIAISSTVDKNKLESTKADMIIEEFNDLNDKKTRKIIGI